MDEVLQQYPNHGQFVFHLAERLRQDFPSAWGPLRETPDGQKLIILLFLAAMLSFNIIKSIPMISKYVVSFLTIVTILSCNKEKQGSTYIVNASKIIGLTRNNWSNAEPQLKNKRGYRYSALPANSGIKAEVHLPALDDSNRVVNGAMLLNIALDNRVQFTMFNTDPIEQSAAYAMMLNYYRGSLQSMTGITSSIGELIENGVGGNVPVSVVLSKLINGQGADQIGIIYKCTQGEFAMVLFKQSDGRFIFSYRGN